MEKYSKFMKDNGWTEDRAGSVTSSAVIAWYKTYETKTRCHCNKDQLGIQILVKGYDTAALKWVHNFEFEISIAGEPKDEVWINFKCYSLRDDELFEKLDQQVAKLLCAWEAINNMGEVK